MPIPQQDKETFWTTVPEPVPLSFTEGVRATFEAGRLTDQSTSTHVQLRDDLKYQFARMNELGLGAPDLPWPLTDSSANMALSWIRSQDEAIKARRAAIEGPPDPFLKTADELLSGVKERVALPQERASRAGGVASFVGGLGVGLTDPFNLATMAMGAGAGATLIRRATTEAGMAAVSQLGVEAASATAKERAGVPVTAGGVLERVATTAVGAAGLVGLFHGAGRVAEMTGLLERYKRGVGSGDIVPTRELDQAAEAIQDHLDTVPSLPTPKAEAAHLDATVAAVDVLSAPTPEARAIASRNLVEKAFEAARQIQEAQKAQPFRPSSMGFDATGMRLEIPTDTRLYHETNLNSAVEILFAGMDRSGMNFASSRDLALGQGGQGVLITMRDPGGQTFVRNQKPGLDVVEAMGGGTELTLRTPLSQQSILSAVESVEIAPKTKGNRAAVAELQYRMKREGWTREKLADGSVIYTPPKPKEVGPTAEIASVPKEVSVQQVVNENIDAAIAKQAASPIPPVVEVPLDAPLARPVQSLEDAAMIAEMRTLAEARPDIRVEVDLGDEVLSGNLSEVMARLDQEEAELGDTTDCLLGGLE